MAETFELVEDAHAVWYDFFLIKYKIEIIYRHTIPLKRQANKLEETWEESTDVKVRVSLQLRFSKKATKIWQNLPVDLKFA